MPKNKSHKGLLKRIKISKTGKIRFRAPNGRHLKSNKTGTAVQSYRKNRYARAGDLVALSKMLFRPLRSQEQAEAENLRIEALKTADGSGAATPVKAPPVKKVPVAKPAAVKTEAPKADGKKTDGKKTEGKKPDNKKS